MSAAAAQANLHKTVRAQKIVDTEKSGHEKSVFA